VRKEKNSERHKINRYVNKKTDNTIDDEELLRLQGLIRCKSCKTPCPLEAIVCPTCGDKA